MTGSEWLYGAIALLVGLHVLTMLYAYRSRGEPATATQGAEAEPSYDGGSDDPGAVVCPHCGASNDREFQFCKHCVADLDGGTTRGGTTPGTRSV